MPYKLQLYRPQQQQQMDCHWDFVSIHYLFVIFLHFFLNNDGFEIKVPKLFDIINFIV